MNNNTNQDYQQFLETKKKSVIQSGFEVLDKDLNPMLFDFQKFVVKRALKSGKYGVFAGCGLGKTPIQLECAKHTSIHTGKPTLIVAPLCVSSQTIQEGNKFSIEVRKYDGSEFPIQITNYEQLNNIDPSIFGCVVLDESSLIKDAEGAYRNLILTMFAKIPYKFAFTATPSPNDPMELGNHSEFLDVMTRNEMLAMYFIHDGGETSKWRLKGHAQKRFYEFVSTWSVMFDNPNDLGFEQEGYELPPLNYIEHMVVTEKRDNGKLFNDTAVNATSFNKELRLTADERLRMVADLVNGNSDESFIIWIKHNPEGDALKKLIPEAIEVKGSDKPEYKEEKLLGFGRGEFRVLITKTKIASYGMNYQHCHNQIFAGLDFSFEATYQGVRRSYRFGQKEAVNIHLITTDTMANVKTIIDNKEKQFKKMQEEMTKAVNANMNGELMTSCEFDTKELVNDWCDIKRGDSVQLIKGIPDESIGLSVYSPPFVDLYTYSNHIEDMGNCKDYEEFVTQYSFLVKELYRVMKSGRNVCVHCMDLPIQKGKDGFIGLRDFSGTIRQIHEDAGFIYHSRVTIWKDPAVEMQRTKSLGLLHKQIKKDSTMSRVGLADYILVFRKDGDRNDPVVNQDTDPSKPNYIPVDLWQKIASPVWMDIDYGKTLNGFRNGREENDERHVCPLQLPTIERCVLLYSNVGDTVFTPFMGIGSEVYQSIKMGRKAKGFELKESYFDLAKKNTLQIISEVSRPTLFD